MHGGLHHLHARKRTYKHLSPYPHPVPWKRWFDHFMYAVGVAAPLALVPQVYELFVFKDATVLSIWTWVFLVLINVLWSAYAFIHRTWPLAVSAVFLSLLNAVIVVGILLYS